MKRDQLNRLVDLHRQLDEAERQLHVAQSMPANVRAIVLVEGREVRIDLPRVAIVQWAINRVTRIQSVIRQNGGTL